MQEFTTVSSSSYDPAALATKLTEKSAEGWTVVSIVSTGGDVTAFLSRESGAAATNTTSSTDTSWSTSAATSGSVPVVESAPEPEPAAEPAAAAEPAGWAVAPEPAPANPVADPQPSTSYASTYTPAAATTSYTPAPAAAAPAVPAGWYADPAGRFELRYWDGGTWTEHVSRAGQQYTDPPVA